MVTCENTWGEMREEEDGSNCFRNGREIFDLMSLPEVTGIYDVLLLFQ